MAKLTLHRALAELKLIDSKITKKVADLSPVGSRQGDGLVNGVFTDVKFSENVKSEYASLMSLIKRKEVIKSLIMVANCTTKVKIGEKEYTITDAITQRNSISVKKEVVRMLKAKYNSTVSSINRVNEANEDKLQSLLLSMYGKEAKTDPKNIESTCDTFRKSNNIDLVDPLNIKVEFERLDEEIAVFEAEVDAILSEINSITMIEIPD